MLTVGMWLQPLLIVLIIINGTLSSSVDEFRRSFAVQYPLTSIVYTNNYCSHFSPEETGQFYVEHRVCRNFVLGLFDGNIKFSKAIMNELMPQCKQIHRVSADVKCALYLRHVTSFGWDTFNISLALSNFDNTLALNGNYMLLDFKLPEDSSVLGSLEGCLNVFAHIDHKDIFPIISSVNDTTLSANCTCEEIILTYKIGVALFVKQEKISGKEEKEIDTSASTTAGLDFMKSVCNDKKDADTYWLLAQLLEILDTIEFEENFVVKPDVFADYLRNARDVCASGWLGSDEESDHHWPFDYMYEKTHSVFSNEVAMGVMHKAIELKMSPKIFDEFKALYLPDGSSLAALESIGKSLEQFKDQLDPAAPNSLRVCETFKIENQLMILKVFLSLFTQDAKENAEEFAKNFEENGLFSQFQNYILSSSLSLDTVYSLASLAQSRNIESTLIVQCLNFFGKVQTRASALLTNRETEFVPNKYQMYDFGVTLFMKGPQPLMDLCSDGTNVRDISDKSKLEKLFKEVLSLDEDGYFDDSLTVKDDLLSIIT